MGWKLVPFIIFLSLHLPMCLVAASVASPDWRTEPTLIYDVDHVHDVPLFCEFAPLRNLPGKIVPSCKKNNPNMTLIRDGENWRPWRLYTNGIEGIILECPSHGMNKSSCTNGRRLYSICKVSCPAGFVNTTTMIECQINGPEENVSASWSHGNFCEPVKIDKSTSEPKEDIGRRHMLYLVLGAVLFVVIVIVIVVGVCRKKNRLFSSKDLSKRTSHSTSSSSIPQPGEGEPASIETSYGISERVNVYDNTFESFQYSARQAPAVEFEGRQEAENLLNGAPKCEERKEAENLLNGAPPLSMDGDEIFAAKPREQENALLMEDKDKRKIGLYGSKPSEEKGDSCKVLIKHFKENLKLKGVDKLAGVLEFCSGRKIGDTLYGYMLHNWEKFGFSSECSVELCQKLPDYRNGVRPMDFFLTRLETYGVSIREVLEYFHENGAQQAVDTLMEFHECKYCLNKFKPIPFSSH